MDEIRITDLDDAALDALQRRAAEHGHSIEQEASEIIREQLMREDRARRLVQRAREIRAMTPVGVQQTDSVQLIREDRDR